MKRRGQVTLIIIVTIVLLAVILIVYTLSSQTNILRIGQGKINPDIQPIYTILDDCIEQRAIDAVWLVGLQGGYVLLPASYIQTDVSKTAYGIWDDKNILPSLNDIEKDIENYISTTIPYCINENNYPDFTITQDIPEVDLKINQNDLDVLVEFPTSVVKGEETTEFDTPYKIEIPIRLRDVYQTAEGIIRNQISDPNHIDLSYLTNLEMDVVFVPVDETSIIYIITDDGSTVNGIPYSFAFGYGYRNEDL